MGNYRTNQFSYSFAQPEHLYAKVSIGASGAPTLVANTGMGITSITRSSAGKYVLTLSHAYAALLNIKQIINSGSSAPAAPGMYVVTDAVSSATAPAVTVQFNAAGTATDPASGEILYIEIELHKGSVRY